MSTRPIHAQSSDRARLTAIARETGYADMWSDPDSERHAARRMSEPVSLDGAECDHADLNHSICHHGNGVRMASAARPCLRREHLLRTARLMIAE